MSFTGGIPPRSFESFQSHIRRKSLAGPTRCSIPGGFASARAANGQR